MVVNSEEDFISIRMETDIMVMEPLSIELGRCLKVYGKMECLMEKYKFNYTTDKDFEELTNEDKKMEGERIYMLMGLNFKVFGKMIGLLVLGLYSIIIIANMKDYLNKTKKMEMAPCLQIKGYILVIGSETRRMEREL
jgi:hypothetical protein